MMDIRRYMLYHHPQFHVISSLVHVAVLLVTILSYNEVQACNSYYSNPLGVVSPDHDVFHQVGTSFVLNCTLFPDNVHKKFSKNLSSENIRFKLYPEFGDYAKWMPSENVEIIDNNTAQLRIENLTMDHNGKYGCFVSALEPAGVKMKNRMVCSMSVTVGYPPLKVPPNDVNCLSMNWVKMTCDYHPPNNTIPTTYKFYYSAISPSIGMVECKPYNNQHKCVMSVHYNTSANEGFYRLLSQYYYFVIKGENMFGTRSDRMILNHYNFVLPDKPDDLIVGKVTVTTVELSWQPPTDMINFPPGLEYHLTYQSQWTKNSSWSISTSDVKTKIKNLIPYTIYTFYVRCKSKSSDSENGLWSERAIVEQRTKATVPTTLPNVTLGMFEEIQLSRTRRSITIYWQKVPPMFHYGADFSYYVTYTKSFNEPRRTRRAANEIPVQVKTTDYYTHFQNFDVNAAYRFYIRVGNSEGSMSELVKSIFVDHKEAAIGKPIDIYAELQDDGDYVVRWKNPTKNADRIVNYTVYWCTQRSSHVFLHCDHPLEFVTVSKLQTELRLSLPPLDGGYYQFAVSSDGRTTSSGMEWTSCNNAGQNKLNAITAEIVDRFPMVLKVSWHRTCLGQLNQIKGYIIEYCKTSIDSDSPICTVPHSRQFASGVTHTHYNLKNLDRYSRYKISVLYVDKNNKESVRSDPVFKLTPEGIPNHIDAPVVTGITNTTINVTWNAPSKTNGIIRRYVVHYNTENEDRDFEVSGSSLRASLSNNVKAYTKYGLAVEACTQKNLCAVSNYTDVVTDIGVPGVMEAPRFKIKNSTFIHVFWKKPKFAGGPLDYCELKLSWINHRNQTNYRVLNFSSTWVNGSNIAIECPVLADSDDKLKIYNLTLRAVNIKNNERLYGKWSAVTEVKMCFAATDKALAIGFIVGSAVGGCVGLTLLCLFLFTLVNWTKRKLREARDIKVQLPKGLESNGMTTLDSYSEFSTGLKLPGKMNDEHLPDNFKQYKRLLPNGSANDTQPKDRHESGDSSYSCNSANDLLKKQKAKESRYPSGDGSEYDSLSSNLTAKTHLSNHSNDSGLHCDLDTSQPSPEVFENSPNFRRRGSPAGISLKLKQSSLPKVDETPDNADRVSESTVCSDDSGTAEMPGDYDKKTHYSKLAPYYDDKLKVDAGVLKIRMPETTVGLVLTDPLMGNAPYVKIGLNPLKEGYIPVHPGLMSFLGKQNRNVAGSESNISEVECLLHDSDSGNSSVCNAVLPPYTRLGLASSHTDVSPSVRDDMPTAYCKFGLANSSDRIGSRLASYMSSNDFVKSSGNVSPTAALYSKFGMLNLPGDKVTTKPYVPIEANKKWVVPTPSNGYVTMGQVDVSPTAVKQKPATLSKGDEGYSRVSATPSDTVPVPRDVDDLEEHEPIVCIQQTPESTGAIPKCTKSPPKINPIVDRGGNGDARVVKQPMASVNGYVPNNSFAKTLDIADEKVDSRRPPDNETATSTPKCSPQPSPTQLPKTCNATSNGYVPYDSIGTNNAMPKSNGYVCVSDTAFVNPSNRMNNVNQPLSCANLTSTSPALI